MQASINKARLSKDRVGNTYQLTKHLVDTLTRTCINCLNWSQNPANEYQYICLLNNQPPPPRIIIVGCDKHTDIIPF